MAETSAPVTAGTAPANPARAIGTPLATAIAVVTTLVGLIVLTWGVLYVTKGRFLKPTFERVVGGMTHREVKVGGDFQLYFDPFDLKFVAERMTIANPAWASKPYLFAAERMDSRIAPLSLLFGRWRFHWLDLNKGGLVLEWDAARQRNT